MYQNPSPTAKNNSIKRGLPAAGDEREFAKTQHLEQEKSPARSDNRKNETTAIPHVLVEQWDDRKAFMELYVLCRRYSYGNASCYMGYREIARREEKSHNALQKVGNRARKEGWFFTYLYQYRATKILLKVFLDRWKEMEFDLVTGAETLPETMNDFHRSQMLRQLREYFSPTGVGQDWEAISGLYAARKRKECSRNKHREYPMIPQNTIMEDVRRTADAFSWTNHGCTDTATMAAPKNVLSSNVPSPPPSESLSPLTPSPSHPDDERSEEEGGEKKLPAQRVSQNEAPENLGSGVKNSEKRKASGVIRKAGFDPTSDERVPFIGGIQALGGSKELALRLWEEFVKVKEGRVSQNMEPFPFPAACIWTRYVDGRAKENNPEIAKDIQKVEDKKVETRDTNRKLAKRLQQGFEGLYDKNRELYTEHFNAGRKIIASDSNLRLEAGGHFEYIDYGCDPKTFVREVEDAMHRLGHRKKK